jgi:hypothetical protein
MKPLMKVDIPMDIQISYFPNASQRFYRFSQFTVYCVTTVAENNDAS